MYDGAAGRGGFRRVVTVFACLASLVAGGLVAVPTASGSGLGSPAVTFTNATDSGISYPDSVAAGPDGAMWVTNPGNNSIGRITTAGVVTNFSGAGINYPFEITAGPDGNLWFTNQGDGSIAKITTAGVVTNFGATPGTTVQGITAGPDGALWYASGGDDSIRRITTAGAITVFHDPTIDFPEGITTGPDGALWFMNNDGNSVGRITTAGLVTNYSDISIRGPSGITTGPDGALWFTNNDSIGRIDPTTFAITSYTDASLGHPFRIVTGPDNALWFTNNDGSIGLITTGGVITSWTNATVSQPAGITAGPDGALWFTNRGNDSIGRITTIGAISNFGRTYTGQPGAIVLGADGGMWFTESADNAIGEIAANGALRTFVHSTISNPTGITAGPDGALWFSNTGNNSIGRITTSGVVTKFTSPSIGAPGSISAGSGSSLWFVNRAGTDGARITTGGAVTEYPSVSGNLRRVAASGPYVVSFSEGVPHPRVHLGGLVGANHDVLSNASPLSGSAITDPDGLLISPSGDLWLVNRDDGSIVSRRSGTNSVIRYPSSARGEIVFGPDAALWAPTATGSVIRMTQAGVATTYSDPLLTDANAIGANSSAVFIGTSNGIVRGAVGPIPPGITIKPPSGFSPGNVLDVITKFTSTTITAGVITTSVNYDVDGTPVTSNSNAPYSVTVDPTALVLAAGSHTLHALTTDSNGQTGTDSITFSVPASSLSLGPSPLAPVGSTATPGPGLHAGWTVPVTNTSGAAAHGVRVILDASDGSGPIDFDTAAMPGCSSPGPGGPTTCVVGEVAAGATVNLPALLTTEGRTGGTVLTGHASATAFNGSGAGPITLDGITMVVPPPNVAQVIAVASPTTAKAATVVNTTAPVTGLNPALIKVAIPRKVAPASVGMMAMLRATSLTFGSALRAAATTSTKPVAPPPVSVTLYPADRTSGDTGLCPLSCRGKISNVLGDFSHFNDQLHPIKVTLKVFLPGATASTIGELEMEKPGGSVVQLSGLGGQRCVKSGTGTSAHYNTPCEFGTPKVATVRATVSSPAGVSVQDTIYFTGADPRFARR